MRVGIVASIEHFCKDKNGVVTCDKMNLPWFFVRYNFYPTHCVFSWLWDRKHTYPTINHGISYMFISIKANTCCNDW